MKLNMSKDAIHIGQLTVKLLYQPRVSVNPVKYNFDEIKNAILSIGQTMMEHGKQFNFEGPRGRFYDQLIYYFFNDSKFEGNLNKGLFVHGGKGSGKSVAFKIFRTLSFNRLIPTGKGIGFYQCDEIVSDYEADGAATMRKYCKGNLCFDDLGDENRPASYYGQKERNVMREILTRRYRAFTDDRTITHLTSNFNFEIIGQQYDLRVQDRFKEMFNDIPLTGQSLRG